jgi:hypothetical protein
MNDNSDNSIQQFRQFSWKELSEIVRNCLMDFV